MKGYKGFGYEALGVSVAVHIRYVELDVGLKK